MAKRPYFWCRFGYLRRSQAESILHYNKTKPKFWDDDIWVLSGMVATSGTVESRPVSRSRKLEQASSDLGSDVKDLEKGKSCWRSSPASQVTVLYDHPVALLHPRLNCGQDHLFAVLFFFNFHLFDRD